MPYNLHPTIIVSHEAWRNALPELETLASKVLEQTFNPFLQKSFSPVQLIDVDFTDSNTIQLLNREHRGKDKPTNVLSFEYYDGLEDIISSSAPVSLGDVVLCYEVIEREAEEKGIPLKHHMIHMLVHGCLHVLGFDHQVDEEAAEMENEEVRILKNFNIPSPYDNVEEQGN